MAFATVPTLKNELGILANDNSQNAELERLINAVSIKISRFIGFDPWPKQTTEFYDGTGSTFLPLLRKPVQSVDSVWVDVTANGGVVNSFTDAQSLLVPNVGYTVRYDPFRAATLVRVNNVWPQRYERRAGNLASILYENPGCIRVLYTAGEVSPLFEQAAITECKAIYSMRANGLGALMSESIGGRSISLTAQTELLGNQQQKFASPLAQLLLGDYQRVAFS